MDGTAGKVLTIYTSFNIVTSSTLDIPWQSSYLHHSFHDLLGTNLDSVGVLPLDESLNWVFLDRIGHPAHGIEQ